MDVVFIIIIVRKSLKLRQSYMNDITSVMFFSIFFQFLF